MKQSPKNIDLWNEESRLLIVHTAVSITAKLGSQERTMPSPIQGFNPFHLPIFNHYYDKQWVTKNLTFT